MTKAIIAHREQTEGHKAQIWILAALSLPLKERIDAMNDIADMLGSTYSRVICAASKLKAKTQADLTSAGYGERRRAYVSAPFRPGRRAPAAPGPSLLSQPTRAQLMAGRAR